ncbi:ATP-binding protein [Nonomuraea jabiensis]|uniref:DNA-binding CsgD family transcriptional regulator/lactam utilization protein B n=1 Tax=Nonomuraea jabiensis TaxID=882448 RepID=A0A7W9LFP3_9ACTN|nr:LuxR family transcriptional regulator [Nonomuraea jabiensis]MBB5782095.1 DNA-binding CsgD family transcriptional regulator/lactam utilization protein B [Nonomuraea jabiensis]
MREDSLPHLRGRQREWETLDRLLQSVRTGQSQVLVLRGEAGIGKTALLDQLCDRASGCQVARAAGVESEMELAFAGLHLLCAPFLDRLPTLPDPQADALRTVFGLRDGVAPDRFLIGLAVLTLLAKVAEERPLICVIDDAQWLDRASAQALAFVARRLVAESVAMVFAVREPADDKILASLPELTVHGLAPDDARALLEQARPGPLDEQVRDRLVAETRGNPLALLEMPRGLPVEELAGGFGPSRWPEVSAGISPGIEESFRRRIGALPAQTRALLLVAAAEPLGDPLMLWRAADRMGIGPAAADPANADGLMTIRERVVFRHPLVRTVVYRSAQAADRRAAHLALAEATGRDNDPARRAWHLAAAAEGPDEEVAAELERSAGQAQARGGLAAAASFLQRAVALTPDPVRRAERALTAAGASVQAGVFNAALGLLATAEAGPLEDLQRARANLLRAQARYWQTRGSEGPLLLLGAAQALEPLDPGLARKTYLDAWSAALFAGAMTRGTSMAEISSKALACPRPEGPPEAADVLLDGLALAVTGGRDAAAPLLRQAADRFSGDGAATIQEVVRSTAAAVMVWDYEAWATPLARQIRIARESGALSVLPVALDVLAQALCVAGDLRGAALLIAEAGAVTQATGSRIASYARLMLAGARGREAEARTLINVTIAEATAAGQGCAVQYARSATAMLCNGLGRYDEALAAAQRAAADTPELFVADWARIELVEAAARAGRPETARAALDRLRQGAAAAGTDWGLGVATRLRALLSDGSDADRLYREAIERLAPTPVRPELARAHLLYGEWLRRAGHRVAARDHLRQALELFGEMRMDAFAERARRELATAGERVRRRRVDAFDELTAQEAEIAQLAVAGRSNPEIGAQLFLSPRTVEWHLRKVFMKLGVSSRRELAGALNATGRTAESA